MATIDLIVLGMLKKESLSAYDLQKLVEYRNISKWVKISTPSIYKKVIQLEQKGYIESQIKKEGKMPEKAVYSLTKAGEKELEKLMLDISCKPINIYLDFNAVIVNMEYMPKDVQKQYLDNIDKNIKSLKKYIENNIELKAGISDIPKVGMEVLEQQYILVNKLEEWIDSLRKSTIQ